WLPSRVHVITFLTNSRAPRRFSHQGLLWMASCSNNVEHCNARSLNKLLLLVQPQHCGLPQGHRDNLNLLSQMTYQTIVLVSFSFIVSLILGFTC
ncbi:hypothetical protein Csa_023518, partial [Cucumis sativus]